MKSVLLLEDELIIAIDMEDILRAQGAETVAIVDTCVGALDWLATNEPDVAIVDPRLKDGPCGQVVRLLAERKIPFVVYSGDVAGALEMETAFRHGIHLHKPSSPDQVALAISEAISGA